MTWSVLTGTSLTLTGTLATVQRSAADWEITLLSREIAHIQFQFNPEASPTEDCLIEIQTSPDGGTTWDTIAYTTLVIDNGTDPNHASIVLVGIRTFRIQAAVLDTDGTAGGDDTASALVVDVAQNGEGG